ncbi:MAG: PKD domain-containing protein [Candidatus Woesearchaeota archaeon]|nr:PKD domain-containing protein [Candidatus Woesearchaeota archaeon]
MAKQYATKVTFLFLLFLILNLYIVSAQKDGMLVYGNGAFANPRYRTWNGTLQNWSTELSTALNGQTSPSLEWVSVAASPVNDEFIFAVADSLDDVKAQIFSNKTGSWCWSNGTNCSYMINLSRTSSVADTQKVAVAYEQLSGRALVVYSNNTPNASYVVWNGSSWTTPASVPNTRSTGLVQLVKLVPRRNTNEIALVWSDINNDLNVMIWNATSNSWGCEPAQVLSQSLPATQRRKFDAAYEYNSGDLFIAHGTLAAAGTLNYTTKTADTCTYTTASNTAPTIVPRDISAKAKTGSDYVLVSINEGTAVDDMESTVWNGTTWLALSTKDTTIWSGDVSGNILADASWLGTSNSGIVVYSDVSPNTSVDYYLYNQSVNTWNTGGPAGSGLHFNPSPNLTGPDNSILAMSFLDENKSFVFIKDELQDLWAKIITLNSSATNTSLWWTNTEGGAALNTAAGAVNLPSFDFAWKVFVPSFAFSVSLNSSASTVVPGQNGTTNVTVTLVNGSSQQVNLTSVGCPSASTCSFNPSNGNPTYTSLFTVATTNTTTPGVYVVNISGTGGGVSKNVSYTVTVPAFNFSVSTDSNNATVVPTQNATMNMTLTLLNGLSQEVNLTSVGCPTDSVCSFTPSSGNPTYTSTFTVATGAATPDGVYLVNVSASGDDITNNVTFIVNVSDSLPVATASVTGSASGMVPLLVNFSGGVTDGNAPLTYFWDFKDGSNDTAQNPSHTYSVAGIYNSSFTVTDFDGDSSTSNVTITVGDFSVDVNPLNATVVQARNTTTFTSVNLLSGTTQTISLLTFGCPTFATCTFNPSSGSPTYNSTLTVKTNATTPAGTYNLNVSGRTSDLKYRSIFFNVTVTDSVPVGNALATPTSGTAPLTVDFTGNVSGGDPELSYLWLFKDGTNSTQQNPQHNFSVGGSYNVSFKATDFDNDTLNSSVLISVCGRFAPSITIVPSLQNGTAGATLNYTANVRNTDLSSCSASTFSLDSVIPANWTGVFDNTTLDISPGVSKNTTFRITSDGGAGAGNYTFNNTATNLNSSLSSSNTSTYKVI